MGFLGGSWDQGHVVEIKETTVVADVFFGPETFHHL